jgi:hypothetical protein
MAETRTRHLRNTSHKRYRLSQLLCLQDCKSVVKQPKNQLLSNNLRFVCQVDHFRRFCDHNRVSTSVTTYRTAAPDDIKRTASPHSVVATCLFGKVHGYIYGHDCRQMASAGLLWLQQQQLTVERDEHYSPWDMECFSHSQD